MITDRDRKIIKHVETDGVSAITIKEAAIMFFKDKAFAYDQARKRLKAIADAGVFKSYMNAYTNEKVYYIEKRLSAHDLFILDFYASLVNLGAEIIEYKKTPRYNTENENVIIPDALFVYKLGNIEYVDFLEVNVGHKSILDRYEPLVGTEELQYKYGRFPRIVVMGEDKEYYRSGSFDTLYIGLDLTDVNKVFVNNNLEEAVCI